MLKNRAGNNILVSLNRILIPNETIDGIYINNDMQFKGEKPLIDFTCRPGQITSFNIDEWLYPYSVLNFKNIDYCIYNRFRQPDEFTDFFEDKIPVIRVAANMYRMVGKKSWFLKTPYIEWIDNNEISIDIGGERLVLF